MQHQQEIGGAQALLQLGTKSKDEGEEDTTDHLEVANEQHHDDEYDGKNQLNEAVEAAVMRYVGGTLDKNQSGKRSHNEVNMNDINQWILDDFDAFDDIPSQVKSSKRSNKKRKLLNVDPELTGLESDHDQLVQDAILNARELTNQIQHDHHIHNHQNHEQNNRNHNQHYNHTNGDRSNSNCQNNNNNHNNNNNNNLGDNNDISAITQLAQAATSLSPVSNSNKKSKKKKSVAQQDLPQNSLKFKHITNIESLVEESATEACNWFNSQPSFANKGPRVFSEIETDAVDHFIIGYCHLYNLTRTDICNRIWSSDRKKDNFWEPLTRVLPYRSRASVYKHVRRQYHVFDVRAKWSKEDDELLRKLSLSQEGRWKEVGEAMGRMPEDCRDRWRNYVKCGDNRASNKWSEAEERQLTDIVTEFIALSKENKFGRNPTINWTIISDKMNGIRSRIQCRYKWNKLIKRESTLRAAYMSLDTKMWLLHKLQQFSSPDLVDWKYIVDLYNQEFKSRLHENKFVWDIPDFKAGFDMMKSESGDIRGQNVDFQAYIRKLINERSFADPHESDLEADKATDNSPNLASAAVAAAATSMEGDSAQPQEYSLWR